MAGKSYDKLVQDLSRQLKVLKNKDSVSPRPSPEQLEKHGGLALLGFEIKDADGGRGYLSDSANTAIWEAGSVVWQILTSGDYSLRVTEEEVYKECRAFIGQRLLQELDIKCATLIERVCQVLRAKIDSHLYVTKLHGVDIENLTRWDVNSFFISTPDKSLLEVCSEHAANTDNIEMVWRTMQYGVWIGGAISGTPKYAEQEFLARCRKIISALAITFCVGNDKGAASLNIGVQRVESRSWFGYGAVAKALRVTRTAGGTTSVRCNQDYLNDLRDNTEWFVPLVDMLFNEEPTEIESAIQRATHWFYDAQSDPDTDMRFLKFWSCIECFFSLDKERVTGQIRDGLSAMLIFGGCRLAVPEEWKGVRKEIDRLYDLRCEAVHEARHGHIKHDDIVKVSSWAGNVILSIAGLVQQGYTTREQVKQQTIWLTSILNRGG